MVDRAANRTRALWLGIVGGVIVIGAFMYFRHQGSNTVSADSSDWTTYTSSSQSHFSFRYPNTWKLIELDPHHSGEPAGSVELKPGDDAFIVIGARPNWTEFTIDTNPTSVGSSTTLIGHKEFNVPGGSARQLETSRAGGPYFIRTEIAGRTTLYTVRMVVQGGGDGGRNAGRVSAYRAVYERVLDSFAPY